MEIRPDDIRLRRGWLLCGVWLCAALLAPRVRAQINQPPNQPPATESPATPPETAQLISSYEGQNVSSVILAGRPDLNLEEFAPVMTQKANEPFSREKVEQTADALKNAGHFEQVHVEVQPDARGVVIYFILEPASWFGVFNFPGADQFPYSQLIQTANFPPQWPYSAEEVETDRASLEKYFQNRGYFEAQVKTELHVDKDNGIVNVDFQVALDKRAKFGTAISQGAPGGQDAALDKKLTGVMARARGASIRPGKTFNHNNVDKAVHYLQSLLEKQGYLSAQVKLEGAEYHPETNRADIHFSIKPGVVTHVQIAGARVWNWTRKSLLPVYQGVGVDQETVQEGQQALISYFQQKGYFDVKVSSDLKTEASGDTVTYTITKENKHKVSSLQITGNTQLPSSTLMPSIAVEKERLLSAGKFSNDLVRKSVDNLTGQYKAEGFSEVKVASSVADHGKDIAVTFTVTEGPRDVVNNVSIDGASTFGESQFAPQGLRVRAGQPYSTARVQQDRNTIIANYLRAGYLNASFRETASQVSKQDPHRINVVYHVSEGPQVMIQNVFTLGRDHTNARVIEGDVKSLQPGKPLTEQDLLASGSKLYDETGVFDWAEVDPKREITTQRKEDVLVKVHEAKRNELQYGFGFEVIERGGSIPSGTVALPNLPPLGLPENFTTNQSTFYGPRGTLQYTRNNVWGRAESLELTAFAGRLDQKLALYYIDPSFRWSSWKATTQASYERNEENPIFSSQIDTGSLQFQRPVDHAQKDIAFFRYSFTKTDLTRVLLEQLVPERDQHIHLSTFAANFTRDTRDNPLDEHTGVLDTLELDFNTSRLGSSVDFAKLTAQAAYYKEKFHHIVWANSIRIGLAQPFSGSFVPLSESFFTGGGNSLRGFPLDGAGPQRSIEVCPNGGTGCNTFIQVPAGGNEQLIVNSEARIPLSGLMKNLGLAVFYDGGNVFADARTSQTSTSIDNGSLSVGFKDFAALYSNSVGFGLRYATPVGPVRIDIGKDLNAIPGTTPPIHEPLQYFITIGQAF